MADQRLNVEEYKRWMKAVNGLTILHKGILQFVNDTSEGHFKALQTNPLPVCTKGCATADNSGSQLSPECKKWFDQIKLQKKGVITWANSKPCEWHKNHWEVAKLFMGKGQVGKTGPADTDTSALLQLIRNNKFFLAAIKAGAKQADQKILSAINMRNQLLHSPDHKLPQTKFDGHMNTIKDVLEIPALSCYPEISTCKKELRELQTYDFAVTPKQEIEGLNAKMEWLTMQINFPQNNDESAASGDASGFLAPEEAERLKTELEQYIGGYSDLEREFRDAFANINARLERLDVENPRRLLKVSLAIVSICIGCLAIFIMELGQGSQAALSLDDFDVRGDYKSLLNTFAQQKGWKPEPKYDSKQELNKDFTATVTIQGNTYTSRPHRNKQMATQEAAYFAYKALYENEPSVTKARPNPLGSNSNSVQSTSSNSDAAFSETTERPPGNNRDVLANFMRLNGYSVPTYKTESSNGKFHSSVALRIPFLWAVENSIRGKGKAEHAVAKLILDKLDEASLSGLSDKEKLKTFSDRKGMNPPKYYPIQSWSNQQDYFCVTLFKGLENPNTVSVYGQLHDSKEESEEGVAKIALAMLQEFNLGSLDTSVVKNENSGTSPRGQSPREPANTATRSTKSSQPIKGLALAETETMLSSSEFNYVGKLKEYAEQLGVDQPKYDVESNGSSQHRSSVTIHLPMGTHEHPRKYYTSKKEAEKQVAYLALKLHFPQVIPENIDNSKSKLQEQCVKVKLSNKPGFLNTPQYSSEKHEQGFFSSVSYILEKQFVGPWEDKSMRAKQEAAKLAFEYIWNPPYPFL